MKNKKSKIVAPALGLILLSTAASISGSVAWFTANRTAKVTAGEFAVVNTNGNLASALIAGAGTLADGVEPTHHQIYQKTGYTLTDSSYDIASAARNIVIPDAPREKAKALVSLDSLVAGGDDWATAEGLLNRGGSVYSAFTWDITFSLKFPAGATKKVGLFFDADKSIATTKRHVDAITDGSAPQNTYYTDCACTTDAVGNDGNLAANDYYIKTPLVAPVDTNSNGDYTDTGDNPGSTAYGFRMAFIPKAVNSTSYGIGKVWSPFRTTDADLSYIENPTVNTTLLSAAQTAFATSQKTVKMENNEAAQKADLTAGKQLIKGNTGSTPDNGTKSSTTALAMENYLGYFGPQANQTIDLTFTCVVWYEGTDPSIVAEATDFEQVATALSFSVSDLTD